MILRPYKLARPFVGGTQLGQIVLNFLRGRKCDLRSPFSAIWVFLQFILSFALRISMLVIVLLNTVE